MRVLVTGATGFVGGRLVTALLTEDHDVTVLVRDAARYRADHPATDVRVVEGDLLDPGSFDEALDVDVAYYLVRSMRVGSEFEERDRRAARNFTDAAAGADLDRLIYLGHLGEGREHRSSSREVGAILEDGAPALTTLRAATIIGAGSAGFDVIRALATRLPVQLAPRWIRTDCQPIAIRDVVAYLTEVLAAPGTVGETYEVGGPAVLTYGDMLERTARLLGRRRWTVPLPVMAPRLSAYWVQLVTDVPASVAKHIIRGLQNPGIVEDDSIGEQIRIHKTGFDDAVAAALAEQGHSVDQSLLQDVRSVAAD